MSNPGPIGAFDSGVGGLSVLHEIRQLLPHEDLIYFADSLYCPYGGRNPRFIRDRAIAIGTYLIQHGAKVLVVACNTIAASGLNVLRQDLNVPIIGIEPAVKPAVEQTLTGKVGVLATDVTLTSERFKSLVTRFGNGVEVLSQPCPGLVEMVESGQLDSARPLLSKYLNPLLQQECSTIVLGCTHYPFLRPLIKDMVGQQVRIIDSGQAVARQVARVLLQNGLQNDSVRLGRDEFFTSGDPEKVGEVIRRLWQDTQSEVERIQL